MNGVKESQTKNYNLLQYQRGQNQQYPNESHGIPGDCINPKCDYMFTDEDLKHMQDYSGGFTCPNCGLTYNYYDQPDRTTCGYTRSGLSMDQMGKIGEQIIGSMNEVPGVGKVIQIYEVKKNPIDAIIGPYGIEIKTNHSEAQPRFKIGGENIGIPELSASLRPKAAKEWFCQQHNLVPGLIGVRLNFYTDTADIFFREGLTDTGIGNPKLRHVGQANFASINPFKNPADVPPVTDLPEDDTTPSDADIPF